MQNIVNIVDSFLALDLGNDKHLTAAAVFLDDLATLVDVLCGTHEAQTHVVDLLFESKQQVPLIFLGHGRCGDSTSGEVDTLVFLEMSADNSFQNGLVVLSSVQAIGDPSSRLSGELRNFGIDAASRTAVVTFDASLRRAGDDRIEKRRFEARTPVAAIDAPSAGVALNEAANQVAAQVADWIGR